MLGTEKEYREVIRQAQEKGVNETDFFVLMAAITRKDEKATREQASKINEFENIVAVAKIWFGHYKESATKDVLVWTTKTLSAIKKEREAFAAEVVVTNVEEVKENQEVITVNTENEVLTDVVTVAPAQQERVITELPTEQEEVITPTEAQVITVEAEVIECDNITLEDCHQVTASVAEPTAEIKQNQYTRRTTGWVGLHAHSHFSILDGFRSPTELVARAKELNQPGIALTDHGGMWGVVELMQAASKAGIKALPGNEMYLLDSDASKRLKEYSGNGDYRVKERYHQLVLAVSKQGYQNLCQLTTDSYLKNSVTVRKKVYPLITKEELVDKKEGLVLTSGCLAGLVCQGILSGDLDFARSTAQWFRDNFGANYYIEIQDHGLEDDQRKVNHHLVAIASELNIGLVVTADSHYVTPEQKEAHKAFLRINKGENFSNVYEGKFWHPSEQEIKERLSYLPEWAIDQAIDNTVLIAQQVEDYTLERKPVSPNYHLPNGYDDADEYLEVLAHQGLVNIKLNKTNYLKRLNYELDILKSKGLSNYFLIVQDYVNWAKEKLIPVGVARGSGGGSLVCYALGITAIDPIKHELIFERFINPERESYPDIDVDFCIERRHEVVDYIRNKYGLDNVANIITFGKLESKSALKDVGWVLGVNYSEQNYYSKQLPVIRGNNIKLSELISDDKLAPEFYSAYHSNKRLLTSNGEITFQKWVNLAIDLEKTIKSSGVHAAGLVIGDVPLGSLIPLQKNVDGTICTQYGMYQVEWMGFLKMDILGLKNLTILDKAQKWLGRSYYDLEQIDLEDKNALSLIASGECEGVFQLESSSAVGLINLIKPTAFSEVADITSLNRPGCLDLGMHYKYAAVKHGKEQPEYCTEELKILLEKTHSQCVYQEQMLRICTEIAGFSLGKADNARRACVSGDTFITIASGWRLTVRDYVKYFSSLSPHKIQCLDEKTFKHTTSTVLDAFYNGHKQVFQLTTKTGRQIKATSSHEFFKLKEWKSLDTGLKIGDKIAVPTEQLLTTGSRSGMSREMIKICAYMIGDGYLPSNDNSAYFCNSDKYQILDFHQCLNKEFGIDAHIHYQKADHQPNEVGYVSINKETKTKLIKKIGGGLSADRFVPEWVWELSKEEMRLFLGTLWCTDGCFSTRTNNNTVAPSIVGEYCSIAQELIRDLQEAFLRIGVVTTVKKKNAKYKGEKYTSYRLFVTGKRDIISFYHELHSFLSPEKHNQALNAYQYALNTVDNFGKYCVPSPAIQMIKEAKPQDKSWRQIAINAKLEPASITSGINLTTIKEGQVISCTRLKRFGLALNNQELINLGSADILWDEIVDIKPMGIEDVYDLTVHEHHNFVANGFYVHNCGKKMPEKMALLKEDFVNGCLKNNHNLEVANELWAIILASAGYTFNASHAKGYTVTSMQCAWMKYYHPAEFFAALMSGQSDLEKIAKYARILKRYNLKLLPPNINNSDADFKPTTNGIIYGLAQIQGLGDGALDKILAARVNRPFESLIDFMLRTNVSSAIAETLIKAGAFDRLHNNRASLLASVSTTAKWVSERKSFVKKEQNALAIPGINWDECLSCPSLIECPELPTSKLLMLEKEAIGLSLSGHPLDDWMIEAEYLGNLKVNQLINGVVLVKNSRYANTKKGESMMFATIEDCDGNSLDVTLFGVNCQCFAKLFKSGEIINISGKVQVYNDKFSMIVDGAYPVSLERASA